MQPCMHTHAVLGLFNWPSPEKDRKTNSFLHLIFIWLENVYIINSSIIIINIQGHSMGTGMGMGVYLASAMQVMPLEFHQDLWLESRYTTMWHCFCDDKFIHSDRTPTCVRHRDRWTKGDSIYCASIASRGKNDSTKQAT